MSSEQDCLRLIAHGLPRSLLYEHIIAPEGRVHFAGEHASLHHAWIQRAIESGLKRRRRDPRDGGLVLLVRASALPTGAAVGAASPDYGCPGPTRPAVIPRVVRPLRTAGR